MAKAVVVFHSQDGNTRKVADEIRHLTGADLMELKIPGTQELVGGMKFLRLGAMALFRSKPRITGGRDLSEYDTIIVGSPVWAGTFSPAIRSFFAGHSLYGASVGAYFCYGGKLGAAPKKLADFLRIGGNFRHVGARDPKVNGTARPLAEKIAVKMGLAVAPNKSVGRAKKPRRY